MYIKYKYSTAIYQPAKIFATKMLLRHGQTISSLVAQMRNSDGDKDKEAKVTMGGEVAVELQTGI